MVQRTMALSVLKMLTRVTKPLCYMHCLRGGKRTRTTFSNDLSRQTFSVGSTGELFLRRQEDSERDGGVLLFTSQCGNNTIR
jgi:hypothetical protein